MLEIVDDMAHRWIALGGDSQGFDWNCSRIRDRVQELINLKLKDESMLEEVMDT